LPDHLSPNNDELQIGANYDYSGTYYDYFKGSIDEVRIYNRALTDNEILSLYDAEKPAANLDSGLVARYPFSGNTNDVSGYNRHAVNYGAAPAPDRFGTPNRAYRFDGTDDYMAIGHAYFTNSTAGLTFSSWVKVGASQPHHHVFWTSGSTGGEVSLDDSLGYMSFGVKQQLYDWHRTGADVDTLQYHHLVGTYRRGDRIELWCDGVFRSQTAVQDDDLFHIGGTPSCIGAYGAGSGLFFDGDIDDFRIYDRALSGEEIQALYALESVFVLAPPQLASPGNGDAVNQHPVQFSWIAADSAASYRIQVSADSLFGTSQVDQPVGGTSFSYDLPDSTYWWRTKSYGTSGDSSGWSSPWKFILGPWATRAPMPTRRGRLGAAAAGGYLYAAGGSWDSSAALATVERYDPASDTWAARAPLPEPLSFAPAAAVGGKVYVVGGYTGSGISDEVYEYDPAGNAWTARAPMPTPRYASALAVHNNKIYCFGGNDAGGQWNSRKAEVFDPAANTWDTLADMPTGRCAAAAAASGGRIYVIGGQDYVPVVFDAVEEYNPLTNAWATKTPMPSPRGGGMAGLAVDGMIHVLGGTCSTSVGHYDDAHLVYDPAGDSWSSGVPMPTARGRLASALVGRKLYAVGGFDNGDRWLATNEEYAFTGLAAPELISPPNNAHLRDTVQFIWHKVDSANVYKFQMSVFPGFDTVAQSAVAETTITFTGGPEGVHYWRVKAMNTVSGDSSEWSAIRSYTKDVTTPLAPVLKGPPDMAWANAGPGLSWSASAGADLYHVQVSSDTNFVTLKDSCVTADTFRYVPPIPDGKYFWRAAAGDSAGNWSAWGEVRRFRLDSTAVKILWTWPVAGQGNVQLSDTVKIRFSEPVTVSSFDYTCNPDPGGWHLTVSPGRDTFRLDHAPFDTSTAYTFTVASAHDSAGNGLAPGPVNNPWTFTVTADGVGPVLRHTPVTAAVDSGTAIPLTAYATDAGSGVQQVILYYRQGGRDEFTETPMSHPSDSTYQAQIPGPEVSVRGVSYYLRAVDNTGAQSFSPAGAPAVRHQPRVALDNVVYGSTLSGGSYRMFAFPFETAGPAWRPSQLADDLGAYDAAVWRLFRWQSGAYAEYEAVQDIVPGRAYWIINRNGGTFDLADGRTVADSSFHLPLASEWNMAGAPFNFPVNLSDVRVYSGTQNYAFLDTANTLTERRLVEYDGSGYSNKTRLDQWKGYWVRALAGGVTMLVPAASATDKSAPLWNPGGWTLSLEATCGEFHDRDNRIGITPRGERDNASEPPPAGPFLSLGIDNGGRRLAEDYREEIGTGQCWRFQVDCGLEGPVDLCWSEEGERGWQYAVYDVDGGRALTGNSFRYQSDGRGAPRKFAVLAGSPEYIASEAGRQGLVPTATLMENARPNPFTRLTNIKYQLTSPGLARLTVYNVLGQRVRTLVNEVKTPGRYEITWDGSGDTGQRAGAGVYFCRMEAGEVCATVRMTLVR
jgi:N-acetylneuraminic acid mutarotase